jgi:hypothetical protein
MDTNIFTHSEEAIQLKKRNLFLAVIATSILLTLLVFVRPVAIFSGSGFAPFVTVSVAFIQIVGVPIILWLHFHKLHQTKITVLKEGIEQKRGMQVMMIDYNQITRLVIHENRDGKVFFIQVFTPKNLLQIQDFMDMNLLAKEISNHLGNNASIQQKRHWVSNAQAVMFVTPALIIFIFGFWTLLAVIGTLRFILWLAAFYFLVAPWFIFYKPFSRERGQRFRPYDIGMGIVSLGLTLVLFFISWTAGTLTRPCGLIGRYIQQSGCIHSFNEGSSVAFMPDGQILVRNHSANVELEPITWGGWLQARLLRHQEQVDTFALSPNGDQIVAWAGEWLDSEATLSLWQVETETVVRQQTFSNFGAGGVMFSPDGHTLVIAARGRIELWDAATLQPQASLEGWTLPAFSPDGQTLAFPSTSGIILRQAADGSEITRLNIPGASSMASIEELVSVKRPVFSPDGAMLAQTTSSGHILLWRPADGSIQAQWPFAGRSESTVAFSPDGRLLAIAYYTPEDDGYLQLWRASDATLLRTVEIGSVYTYRPESVAFSPSGELIAIGTPREAMVFEVSRLLNEQPTVQLSN